MIQIVHNFRGMLSITSFLINKINYLKKKLACSVKASHWLACLVFGWICIRGTVTMRLCSRHNLNLTIVMYQISENRFVYREGNWFNGPYAKNVFESFTLDDIDYIKKYWPNACRFIFAESVGEYFAENDTYTGALGLITEGKGDIFARPMEYLIDKKVYYTSPMLAVNYYSFQLIDDDSNAKMENENLIDWLVDLIPSVNFCLIASAGVLVYLLSSFLLNRLKSPHLKSSKGRSLKVLVVFYVVFLFFISEFFNGNLNTSNVIVDVSELLSTREDLLETNKEPCFIEKSAETDHFSKAAVGSFCWKIWEKRNKEDICFGSQYGASPELGSMLKRKFEEIWVVAHDIALEMSLRVAHTFTKRNIFISQEKIYEASRATIARENSSDEIKKLCDLSALAQFVYGLLKHNLNSMPNLTGIPLAKTIGKGAHRAYHSLIEYIDENTRVEALGLGKLAPLFKIYFGFLASILVAFLVHSILVRKEEIDLFKRKIILYFYVFIAKLVGKNIRAVEN